MAKNVLHIENVTMQFGGVVAVNNFSMDVNEGEIVALIGPNGAGKTTAFNVITGVYEPTNGSVSFNGQVIAQNHPTGKMKRLYAGDDKQLALAAYEQAGKDASTFQYKSDYHRIVTNTPDRITKLGIARTFQNIRLFKSMTVFDNVLIAKHMRAKHNVFSATFRLNAKEERRMREETTTLLEEQDLLRFKDEISGSLPYGLQRRLEIARALATDPQLLLLDEPAAGMNPQETQELGGFIRQIRDAHRLSILVIEHHMDLVMEISERIYVLDFGKLIAQGTPAMVQDNPAVITAYLGVEEE